MKRREAIKKTALLMGYAVSASAITGVMSGCQADTKTPADEWKPKAFSEVQMNTLREAGERIVPATEGMVGAKDVMAERFTDELAAGFYDKEESDAFKKGLDDLESAAQAAYQKSFADLEGAQMDELITKLMNEAAAAEGKNTKEEPFFFALKGAVLLGFFTSEEVGKNVLNYDPIPQNYDGCIDLSEVPNGRTWSL